ncbi:MAG: hypothetical protein FD146_2406 [Anaerolineaceae bacterium]|nr:MAG: hypothetical protein FD146_2406 [Anaerolineaceae bacterium]
MKRTISLMQVFIASVLLSSLFGCGEPKKPTEELKPTPTKAVEVPTLAKGWDEKICLSGEGAPDWSS